MPPLSYSITSLAPQEINQQFFRVKQHFNSVFKENVPSHPEYYILKNMAHVTLKRLFYLQPHIRDEEVRSALSSIRFKPIPITADRTELFRTEKHGNVLVILVNKTPELQKLHDDLSSLVDSAASEQDTDFEKANFNPHLSVLYNLPENRIAEAKKYAEENLMPLTYNLSSFLFMREVPGVRGEREMLREYFSS